jgi:hypothetical protein
MKEGKYSWHYSAYWQAALYAPRIQQAKKEILRFPVRQMPITASTFKMQRTQATPITIQALPILKIRLNWGWPPLKLTTVSGKVEASVDLGFGRRAEEFSYNDGDLDQGKNGFLTLAAVKQLYLSYAPFFKSKIYNG